MPLNQEKLVVPAWIAGTQKPWKAYGSRPSDLDTGNPCRYDVLT
ncbi:MAG TPA: hypothetical protein VIJ25_21395 [Methylococcales bacterium]